jgi:endoglucanase
MRKPIVVVALVAAAVIVAAGVGFGLTRPAAAPVAGTPSATPTTGPRAFASSQLYLDPHTEAAAAAQRLDQQGDTEGALIAHRIAGVPTAVWLGEWFQGDRLVTELTNDVVDAEKQGATPVFVAYAIPNRDCGGYSKGGLAADQYLPWIRTIAATLRDHHAVVLLEPDSLAMLSASKCDGSAEVRLPLLKASVGILESAGVATYLDGGNARWLSPSAQAAWLEKAGVEKAHGFFTNVSNFDRTQSERDYAGKLSSKVGWKHYVIDVSRNGNGWKGTWCNPSGAKLGQDPEVTEGGGSRLDALLWVKHPGVSDGTCNGGPAAGDWWQAGAEALVSGDTP